MRELTEEELAFVAGGIGPYRDPMRPPGPNENPVRPGDNPRVPGFSGGAEEEQVICVDGERQEERRVGVPYPGGGDTWTQAGQNIDWALDNPVTYFAAWLDFIERELGAAMRHYIEFMSRTDPNYDYRKDPNYYENNGYGLGGPH